MSDEEPKAKRPFETDLITVSDDDKNIIKIEFNAKQLYGLEMAKNGHSMFISGPAGSGKSFLLEHIIEWFKVIYSEMYQVVVAASTGIAAANVNGRTACSYFKCGFGKQNRKYINRIVKTNKEEFKNCKVLIIDEVSMIDAESFDSWNEIMKTAIQGPYSKKNKNRLPFGGIQVILVGDLLQLPYVTTSYDKTEKKPIYESYAWKALNLLPIILDQPMRQINDEFFNLLNRIRFGKQTLEDNIYLGNMKRPIPNTEIEPTWLLASNNEANAINQTRLDSIQAEKSVYVAIDTYNPKKVKKEIAEKLLNEFHRALSEINLKPGAQVLITQNLDVSNGITNGTRACVVTCYKNVVIVRLADGRRINISPSSFGVGPQEYYITRIQIPLQLAWAITIHKSQGMTISRFNINASKIFATGQLYTALSRARSPDDVQIIGYSSNKIIVDQKAINFYEILEKTNLK